MWSGFILSVVIAYFLEYVPHISASHFRGAIFSWKPGSNANEITVEYRVSWRTSYGGQVACSSDLIRQEKIVNGEGSLECLDNCGSGSSIIGLLSYKCTDNNIQEDWSSGKGAITHTFISTKTPPSSFFEFGFSGMAWISTLVKGGNGWVLRSTANLSPRQDNGRINSSPKAEIPPIIRIQHGCNHTIKIPVFDTDGDVIRCRWAVGSKDECGGICESFPYAVIENECTISYNAIYTSGLYAVALQVEDFYDAHSTTPLSSIPVQFLVDVYVVNSPCAVVKIVFVSPNPPENACISVKYGDIYESAIVARTISGSISISEIKTISPVGMRKYSLHRINDTDWRMNITFTPAAGMDKSNMFCFSSEEASGSESKQRCVTFLVGVSPPRFIEGSPSGTVDQNQRKWVLQSDSNFKESASNGSIRMYNSKGHLVEAINTSDRNAVAFHGKNKTLQFQTTSALKPREIYYFLLDSGIVKGTSYCGLESEQIVDPTFWKIRIRGVTPPKVSFTNSSILPNSTTERLTWNVDEFVIANCTIIAPYTDTERTSCTKTCIDTSPTDGNYTFSVHVTDLDGLQTAETHSWFVGNCSGVKDSGCRRTNMICVSFERNANPLPNTIEPLLQTPVVDLKASNGFSNEPVQLTISAQNLSGTLDDIIIYVNGIPTNTSFTKGTVLNDTLLLTSEDFGEMNMTTTYQGEIMLTVHTIQHFALVNISSISEFHVQIYPKVEEIDIHLSGCFSEEGIDTPVALLNSSVVFGNKLLDYPSSTSLVIPKVISLLVPSWITPYGTSGGTGQDYIIETNVLNGVLELNSRYEPFNISVHVSIEPKGLPASEFSKSIEINRPCIGESECNDFWFGVGCKKECMCNINHSVSCDKYTGACFCDQKWTGKTCNEFVCPCVYNHTSSCDVVSKICSCKGGWTDTGCATDIDECKDSYVCDMFPNTACQNRDWGYDCLCLIGYQHVNDTCNKINSTKSLEQSHFNETTAVKETDVLPHFDFHVPDTDNLMVEVTYQRYKRESIVMLSKYYKTKLGDSFKKVLVHNVSVGSLRIEHTVEIADNDDAEQELAESLFDISTKTETYQFTFENKTTSVKKIYVKRTTVYERVESRCSIYTCDCEERNNKPYCRPIKEESKDYTKIIASVSSLFPLSLMFALYRYCRKRRKANKKDDKQTLQKVKGDISDSVQDFENSLSEML